MKFIYKFFPKNVIQSLFSLILVQGTNFLVPLIVSPLIIYRLGEAEFGKIAFIQVIMLYLVSLTDYGFSVSAVGELSKYRDNPQKISQIFYSVFYTKLLLVLIAFLIIVLICQLPFFIPYRSLCYWGFMYVVGQSLFPIWFFQGLEKMHYLVYSSFLARVSFVLSVVFLIYTPAESKFYLFYWGVSNLLAALLSYWIIYKKIKLIFHSYSWKEVLTNLWNDIPIFLSSFSIALYMNSNIFILRLFSNDTIVGYYKSAEIIITAVRQLLAIYFQATYVHVCRIITEGHTLLIRFFKSTFPVVSFVILLFSLFLFFFAKDLITLMNPNSPLESVQVLKYLSFIPFIVALNIPAYQTLLAYKYKNSYMSVLIAGSFLNIIINYFLAKSFFAQGTAISVVITEIFITVMLYAILKKHPQHSIL